jgi:hypothetical protein
MIELWKDVVELNDKAKADLIEQLAVDRAGELIGHFDAFDPTGQVFRYPEDIKGSRHLAQHKLINVEVLHDHMCELQDILERWVDRAAHYREWQLEQRAVYGP